VWQVAGRAQDGLDTHSLRKLNALRRIRQFEIPGRLNKG
jgi:hypothetical protein